MDAEPVKEEYCHWGFCSGMSEIPAGSSVGWLSGHRYATGRCLQDRAEVKEFILVRLAARDCGIGGGRC